MISRQQSCSHNFFVNGYRILYFLLSSRDGTKRACVLETLVVMSPIYVSDVGCCRFQGGDVWSFISTTR